MADMKGSKDMEKAPATVSEKAAAEEIDREVPSVVKQFENACLYAQNKKFPTKIDVKGRTISVTAVGPKNEKAAK